MNIGGMYAWIVALRTGQLTCTVCGNVKPFVQGMNSLENNYPNGTQKQCCLGVVCYVARANGVGISITGPSYDDGGIRPNYFDHETGFMPESVAQWLQIDRNPHIPLLGSTAAHCNDSGYTFADIAEGLEDMVRQELGLTRIQLPERRKCGATAIAGEGPCEFMTLPGSNRCVSHFGTPYDTWDIHGNAFNSQPDSGTGDMPKEVTDDAIQED